MSIAINITQPPPRRNTMQVRELLAEKTKMKARDAWDHYEKVKQMAEKGQMTQRQVDGALATAKSLMDTEMAAREKSFLDKHGGSDWWELARKQYPIEELSGGGFRVKSEAKEWKNDKNWEFDYKVQAMEKIEQLVKWLNQNRKRGFGDKDVDLDKFYAKYGNKEVKESKDAVGWYVEDSNDKKVAGPMSEADAKKKCKELGGDAKGFTVGYESDYSARRNKER